MIKQSEMLPMLVEACPSFADTLKDYREFFDEEITYVELGAFANHLVELYKTNKTENFEEVFDVIEKFHIKGDDYVKEAATIDLLEGLQNIANSDSENFVQYLNPESLTWWNELTKFWNGETRYVGETINAKS